MPEPFNVYLVLALYVPVSVLIRIRQRSWFSPPAFFALFWTMLCGLSVLLAPDFYFSAPALLFILGCILIFYTGFICLCPEKCHYQAHLSEKKTMAARLERSFLWFTPVALLAGFGSVYLLLRFYGIKGLPSGMDEIRQLSGLMTDERYGGLALPRSVMLLLAIAYCGSLTGGFVFGFGRKLFTKAVSLLPFIPVLIFTLIYTARAPLLYQLVLFLSSLIVTRLALADKAPRLFTPRFVTLVLFGAGLVISLFMITQMTRMDAGFNREQLSSTFVHLRSWFFGNVSGFSVWFDQGSGIHAPAWGSYSIGGIYELLGLSTRIPGLYDVQVSISPNDDHTNIYTLYRLLIDDFTLFGIPLIFFLSGLLSAAFYRRVVSGRWLFIPLLCIVYALLMWSFIASFLTYNTNILALALFMGLTLLITETRPKTGTR
ncbi:MAG TPA: O-antigen polymerase [Bacteroidales bacterium]|nr:O-antigen polymerase [Bacteroidales bacterium]HSA43530.1 O-antigen polymerase [Bacteroidales bacterium]